MKTHTNNFDLVLFARELKQLFKVDVVYLDMFKPSTDPALNNIIRLFELYWYRERVFFKTPLAKSKNKIPTSDKSKSWYQTFIKRDVVEDTTPNAITAPNPETDIIRARMFNLIKLKIQNDPTCVTYGSFSQHLIDDRIQFNDIDFYTMYSFRFMIVLLVLARVLYNYSGEIVGIPFLVGHLLFFIKLDTIKVDICDCFSLSPIVLQHLSKHNRILSPTIQFCNVLKMAGQRTKTADLVAKYLSRCDMLYGSVDIPMSKPSVQLGVTAAIHKELQTIIGDRFLYIEGILDPLPVFIIYDHPIPPKTIYLTDIGAHLDKFVRGKFSSESIGKYRLRKSINLEMYLLEHIYEIVNGVGTIVGYITSVLFSDIFLNKVGGVTDDSRITIAINFAVYTDFMSRYHNDSAYTRMRELLLYNMKELCIKGVSNTPDDTMVARFKAKGPHVTINLEGAFMNLILPKRETFLYKFLI